MTEEIVELTAVEVFNGAADLIEKNGLAKVQYCTAPIGVPWKATDQFCVIGAVEFMSGHTGSSLTFSKRFRHHKTLMKEMSFGDIVDWSDAPMTTKEEAATFLREIAKKEAKATL